MKPLLTQDAILLCGHKTGRVSIAASQRLVTIEGRRILVEPDPQGRPIGGCSNVGGTMKPCLTTLAVRQGYSDLVRIGGRRVCLKSVTGLTDGTPPGTVKYSVSDPGQRLVRQS